MLGVEMMIGSVFKALGIKGDEVVKTVMGISEVVENAKTQMDRIEAKQNAIMAHFGIQEIVAPHEATQLRLVKNGEDK